MDILTGEEQALAHQKLIELARNKRKVNLSLNKTQKSGAMIRTKMARNKRVHCNAGTDSV
jgi:hypothetical protein